MRIAAVTHSLSMLGGGIPAVMRPVYRQITTDRSIVASLFGLADSSPLEPESSWGSATPLTFLTGGPPMLGYSRELRRALIEFNGDVMHTHGIFKHTSADVHTVSKRRSIPYVVAAHGMMDPWALEQSKWKKTIARFWFETAHLRDAKCFHALSRSEAADIRRRGYQQPICVIPNGVDLPASNLHVTKSDRPKTLLFLGRIHTKKGLQELLLAWKRCHRDEPSLVRKCQLMIAGWDDGGHEQQLQTWTADNGLSDSVQFVGPVFGEAKLQWLAESDGFVLPSFSEGLPMSVLEAWSYRLPVIMTDHCHLPQGFAHDAAVRITTEVDSITAGLRQWMESQSDELQRIGDNGYELVSRAFTWTKIAAQYVAMYRWMLGDTMPDFVITGSSISV